jgi:tRNA(Met) C34 N-acetyltransferase TmcA
MLFGVLWVCHGLAARGSSALLSHKHTLLAFRVQMICYGLHFCNCRKPTRLHYLGVSFGLTQQLFNFWQRAGYEPLYVRQNASETTGARITCLYAIMY